MSESPIMTFVRGTTLLAVLITLPGIAVCWNHLPKDIWNESVPKPIASKAEKTAYAPRHSDELARGVSIFAPESVHPPLPELGAFLPPIQTEYREKAMPVQNHETSPDTAIQQVSWNNSSVPDVPHNFESLGTHLESLGATYYKVEKWGYRGEFFMVTCFIALSADHTHAKHFQAIGSDAVTAMQTVIVEVERWKNAR